MTHILRRHTISHLIKASWNDDDDDDDSNDEINSTFNHAIGPPEKNRIQMPLFDYEKMLYNALQSNRHIWIKKVLGLQSLCLGIWLGYA